MSVNFAGEVSLSYFEGIFNMQQSLTTWGRRLYFPSEGSHAMDFSTPSSSAGFELADFGLNGKYPTITTRLPKTTMMT
jgi:hypothetical protein